MNAPLTVASLDYTPGAARQPGLPLLPCHSAQWKALARAQQALLLLDEAACIVEGIRIGADDEPVLRLHRAPTEGLQISCHAVTRTGLNGQSEHVMRGRFARCWLEWGVKS